MILWSGLSLFVRHVGILCIIFNGIVIIANLKMRSWKHLAIFMISSSIILCGICYKMKKDLGIFRLSTFDGWGLWSIAYQYINLEPEYRNNLESKELKLLYDYFASYPPDLYTEGKGLGHLWDKNYPAKRLLFIYIEDKQFDYPDAWVIVNDKLKLISMDILLNHIPEYLSGFYLSTLLNAIYPDMKLDDTYWYGYYPKYPITPTSLKSRAIKNYYNQDTETWFARFDIFPKLKPFIDLWTRALTPVCLVLLIVHILFRKKLNIYLNQVFYITVFSFVFLYIFGVTGMIIFFSRYLTPLAPLLVTLNFIELQSIFHLRFTIK